MDAGHSYRGARSATCVLRSLTAHPDLYLSLRAITRIDDRLRAVASAVSLRVKQKSSIQNPNRTSAVIDIGGIDRSNELDINISYAIEKNNVEDCCKEANSQYKPTINRRIDPFGTSTSSLA